MSIVTLQLNKDGDHLLTVPLTDLAGDALTGATLTGQLKTRAGAVVQVSGGGGDYGPLTLTDVGDGTYTSDIRDDLDVQLQTTYKLHCTATKAGKTMTAVFDVLVVRMGQV